MKCQIQGHAPTIYQMASISRFGIPVTKNMGGSFSICKAFDTVHDAIEHLYTMADRYYDEPKELMKARHEAKHNKQLTIDAATARIVTDPQDFKEETK